MQSSYILIQKMVIDKKLIIGKVVRLLQRHWPIIISIAGIATFLFSIADKNYYIGGDVMYPMNISDKMFMWNSYGESLEYLHVFWYWFYGFLNLIKIPSFLTLKILIVLLFTTGFVFTYLLFREIFPEYHKKWAYLSAMFFILNPIYFLLVTAYLPLYGFPVCLYFLVKFVKSKNLTFAILFAICLNLFFFIDLPQPKILLIFPLSALAVVLISKPKELSYLSLFLRLIALAAISLLINAFTIIPYIYSTLFGVVRNFSSNVSSHGGKADLGSASLLYISRFFNYSIVLIYPHISKYLTSTMFVIWTLLLWLVLCLGVFIDKVKNHKKLILLLFSLLIIFIAKGPNPPFGYLYTQAMVYIPLLRVFRTTSSIASGAVILYSLLLAISIADIVKRYGLKKIFPAIVLIHLVIFYPIIKGDKYFNTTISENDRRGFKIPDEYFTLQVKLDGLKEAAKVLELPFPNGYVTKTWGYMGADPLYWISAKETIFRPDQSGLSLENLGSGVETNQDSSSLFLNNVSHVLIQKDSFFSVICESKLIGKTVHSDEVFDLFEINKNNYYPRIYLPEEIVDASSTSTPYLGGLKFIDPSLASTLCPSLGKVNNPKNLLIVSSSEKEIDYKEWLPGANYSNVKLIFNKNNPTTYTLIIKNAGDKFILVFNENFHPKWKIYAGKREFFNNTTDDEQSHRGTIQEYKNLRNNFWDTWFRTPVIQEDRHFTANGYANGWLMETEKICKTDPSVCSTNADGTVNISLTIDYWPQRLFFMGMIASGITILVCLLGGLPGLIKTIRKK